MKRTPRLSTWGPRTTAWLLDCGHTVTLKTRATVPQTIDCKECDVDRPDRDLDE